MYCSRGRAGARRAAAGGAARSVPAARGRDSVGAECDVAQQRGFHFGAVVSLKWTIPYTTVATSGQGNVCARPKVRSEAHMNVAGIEMTQATLIAR